MEESIPRVHVQDARTLRALAHPLRLRLIDELTLRDAATATELAELVNESPANCSWHLRQLAKHGFIEEVASTSGRQKPWRLVVESRSWDTADDDPEVAAAGSAAVAALVDHEYQAYLDWRRWRASEPRQWLDASGVTQSVGWCTPEELREINDSFARLLGPYLDRVRETASRPKGARLARFVAWGIPARPLRPGEADG